MRYLAIVLFLMFVGCKTKSEVKTEAKTEIETEVEAKNGIDKTVYEMWNSFIKLNPEFEKDELPESLYFHDNKEDANRLGKLILKGEKSAGSSLYALYEKYNVDLPKVGTKQIVTDFDGKALAIIEIKKVDTIPFYKISTAYAAMDMGTKINPLEKWKKAHWDFFSSVMKESGTQPTEEMLVVCERFKVIWADNN